MRDIVDLCHSSLVQVVVVVGLALLGPLRTVGCFHNFQASRCRVFEQIAFQPFIDSADQTTESEEGGLPFFDSTKPARLLAFALPRDVVAVGTTALIFHVITTRGLSSPIQHDFRRIVILTTLSELGVGEADQSFLALGISLAGSVCLAEA
jgi:hypothetical protein